MPKPRPLAQDEYEEQVERAYPGYPGPVPPQRAPLPGPRLPEPRSVPLAPEGVESPLANWARRLIIGPRSIVEQTLREEAQTRQDAARSREAMALEGRRETRGRENLLLSIREGARVAEERAARERAEKRTYEQAQRDALAKVVGPRLPPMPTLGVGILSTGERVPVEGPQAPPYKPDLADLLPFEKGLEVHKALTEKPETVKGVPPEHDIIGPRGEIIRKGTPKAPKAWYEGLTLPEMAMMEANLEAKVATGQASPNEEAQLAQLQAGMMTYERSAGILAEWRGAGGERGRYVEEQRQTIGEKASQYVHPQSHQTPPPWTPTSIVQRDYRHIPTARAPEAPLIVSQLIGQLTGVVARRSDLFPAQGFWAQRKADIARLWAEKSGDPDVALIGSLMAVIPTLVRSFGDTGNIAVAERQMTEEAVGLRGDSNLGALRRLNSILHMSNQRLKFHGLDPIVIPELTHFLEQLEGERKAPTDSKGREIPAPSGPIQRRPKREGGQ